MLKKSFLKFQKKIKEKNLTNKNVPYRIYNLGNLKDERSLKNYLRYIEKKLNLKQLFLRWECNWVMLNRLKLQ